MSNPLPTRRDLFRSAAIAALAEQVIAQTTSASRTGLPTRVLGRTGVQVSILGLGGAHIGRVKDDAEAIRIMHAAMDEGMTFWDNAWEYNRGRSEDIMGKALKMDSRRSRCFLMTKVCSREYKGAMEQLEESLKRMQTDHLDLWQFHECNYHNDPEWVQEKGALRAAIEARKQGKVRYIGFTGHKAPAIHLKMLAVNFPWDACQMPNNIMDSRFMSFREEVMPVCLRKKVGIIGMKGFGGDAKMLADKIVSVEEAYRYCLSQPVSTHVVGITTMEELQTAIRFGRSYKPLEGAEKSSVLSRIKEVQGDGRFELFKTSKRYDSAYHREQHGFALQGI